jgi:hypothetical protein
MFVFVRDPDALSSTTGAPSCPSSSTFSLESRHGKYLDDKASGAHCDAIGDDGGGGDGVIIDTEPSARAAASREPLGSHLISNTPLDMLRD